jgi:hypothetical protein
MMILQLLRFFNFLVAAQRLRNQPGTAYISREGLQTALGVND